MIIDGSKSKMPFVGIGSGCWSVASRTRLLIVQRGSGRAWLREYAGTKTITSARGKWAVQRDETRGMLPFARFCDKIQYKRTRLTKPSHSDEGEQSKNERAKSNRNAHIVQMGPLVEQRFGLAQVDLLLVVGRNPQGHQL